MRGSRQGLGVVYSVLYFEAAEQKEKQEESGEEGGGSSYMDDSGNYYFGDFDKIDKLLSVEVYAQYMPTILAE